MKALKQISDDVMKIEHKNRKEVHEEQFQKTREAEVALQVNWNDSEARRVLNKAQQILEEERQHKLEALVHNSASHWIQIGDKCSKSYFKFHKGPRKLKNFNFKVTS